MHILMLLLLSSMLVFAGITTACADDEPRVPVGALTPVPEGDGWIDLFDEEHAAHWRNVSDRREGIFSIDDGIFHIQGRRPTRYIAWMGDTFGDFELHIEFKLTPDANSGVFVRTDPDNPVQGGMEVQVLEDYGRPPTRESCGSLYDVATPMFNMSMPPGEWNSFDIRFQGSRLEVLHNGWKVLDVDVSLMTMPIGKFDTPLALMPAEGRIILQDHGDEVWFRNLRIRRL